MATGDTMTFVINDTATGTTNPVVQITLTENSDGTITFQVVQLMGAGNYLGDLRGLFFDLADESLIGSLSTASNALVTELQQGDDTVKDLGSGANMQGLLGDSGGYDVGVEFGTAGIGALGDDIRSVTFTLDSASRDLTLSDFASVAFGVRITSIGQDVDGNGSIDGARNLSAKINETTFNPEFLAQDDAAVCVDEGKTGSVANVFDNDDDGNPATQEADLDIVQIRYDSVDYFFDSNDATNDFVEIDLVGGGTVKIWQNGDYQVDATGVNVAAEISHDLTYTVQKTFYETNGTIAGTSTEKANLAVEICPVDEGDGGGGGGGDGPGETREFCFSGLTPGAWKSIDNGAGIWDDGYAVSDSFEAVFGISIANWPQPPAGTNGDIADPTLLQALDLGGGDGAPGFALARHATAALLNAADSASTSPELGHNYRFTETEIKAAMKWVYGLDSDIDRDGDIDINANADNVYNEALGTELHNVLAFWNEADEQPDRTICITLAAGETPDTLFEVLNASSPEWLVV